MEKEDKIRDVLFLFRAEEINSDDETKRKDVKSRKRSLTHIKADDYGTTLESGEKLDNKYIKKKKEELKTEYRSLKRSEKQSVKQNIKETLDEFELLFCEQCIQMTNHIEGVCQKCTIHSISI